MRIRLAWIALVATTACAGPARFVLAGDPSRASRLEAGAKRLGCTTAGPSTDYPDQVLTTQCGDKKLILTRMENGQDFIGCFGGAADAPVCQAHLAELEAAAK